METDFLKHLREKFKIADRIHFTEIVVCAVCAFLTFITMANDAADIGDVYYVWLIAMGAFLAIACVRKFRIFDIYAAAGTKNYVLAGIFSALFIVMSPLSEVVQLGCFRFAGKTAMRGCLVPFNWLFFLASAAALYGCVLFALRYSDSLKAEGAGGKECSLKTFWVCFGVIAAVSLACAFAGYPGVMNYDSISVWTDNRDWHTYTYILYTKLCMAIWYNPFSIVLMQTLIWIATNFLLLRTLLVYKDQSAVIMYTVMILTVGLGAVKYLSSIYKDVVFSMGMLGFTVSMYRLMKKMSIQNLILTAVYAVFAASMRHGAVYPVAAAFLVILIARLVRKNFKTALRIASCCIVPFIVVYGGFRIYIQLSPDIAKNPSYVAYTIPLYMLGAYAAYGDDISEETIETMEKIMPLEEWRDAYLARPYYADALTRTWGDVGDRIYRFDELGLQDEVIKANWEFFTSDPLRYLECLFDINSLVWEMSRPEGTVAEESYYIGFTTGGAMENAAIFMPLWYPSEPNVLNDLLTPVAESIYNIPVWRILAYRAGIHNWWTLFSCAAVWRRDRELIVLALPYILYAGTLLISLPAEDIRYSLPFVEFTCFFIAVCFCKDRKLELKPVQECNMDGQESVEERVEGDVRE